RQALREVVVEVVEPVGREHCDRTLALAAVRNAGRIHGPVDLGLLALRALRIAVRDAIPQPSPQILLDGDRDARRDDARAPARERAHERTRGSEQQYLGKIDAVAGEAGDARGNGTRDERETDRLERREHAESDEGGLRNGSEVRAGRL